VNFRHWKELSGIGKTQNVPCKSTLDFHLSRTSFVHRFEHSITHWDISPVF